MRRWLALFLIVAACAPHRDGEPASPQMPAASDEGRAGRRERAQADETVASHPAAERTTGSSEPPEESAGRGAGAGEGTSPGAAGDVQTAEASAGQPQPAEGASGNGAVEIAGVTFVVRTVGAGADERLPMVVALHGLGDVPERFVEAFEGMPVRMRVAAARAPDPYRGGGFAWLPVPRDLPVLRRALRRDVGLIEGAVPGLTARFPTCGPPLVAGFSQGAMVAYALGASRRPVLGGVVPVSGMMPVDMVPRPAPDGAPRIRGLHGDADTVVPIGRARAAVAALRRAGYDVDLQEYPGVGHTITAAMHRDIAARLSELSPACSR